MSTRMLAVQWFLICQVAFFGRVSGPSVFAIIIVASTFTAMLVARLTKAENEAAAARKGFYTALAMLAVAVTTISLWMSLVS